MERVEKSTHFWLLRHSCFLKTGFSRVSCGILSRVELLSGPQYEFFLLSLFCAQDNDNAGIYSLKGGLNDPSPVENRFVIEQCEQG